MANKQTGRPHRRRRRCIRRHSTPIKNEIEVHTHTLTNRLHHPCPIPASHPAPSIRLLKQIKNKKITNRIFNDNLRFLFTRWCRGSLLITDLSFSLSHILSPVPFVIRGFFFFISEVNLLTLIGMKSYFLF